VPDEPADIAAHHCLFLMKIGFNALILLPLQPHSNQLNMVAAVMETSAILLARRSCLPKDIEGGTGGLKVSNINNISYFYYFFTWPTLQF
jgi:hypothetical protein